MNSASKAPIGTSAKVFLIIFVVFGALRLVDYIFYGQELRNLIAAVGFMLMSYGVFKNGLGKVAPHHAGRYASIVGVVMVLASFAVRYLA